MTNGIDEKTSDWLQSELEEDLDEDYELELGDSRLPDEVAKLSTHKSAPSIDRREYFGHLLGLQRELIKLQNLGGAQRRQGRRAVRGP